MREAPPIPRVPSYNTSTHLYRNEAHSTIHALLRFRYRSPAVIVHSARTDLGGDLIHTPLEPRSVQGLGLVKSASSQTGIRPSFPPATSHRFLASASELLNSLSSSSPSPNEADEGPAWGPASLSPSLFWEERGGGGAFRANARAWTPFLWWSRVPRGLKVLIEQSRTLCEECIGSVIETNDGDSRRLRSDRRKNENKGRTCRPTRPGHKLCWGRGSRWTCFQGVLFGRSCMMPGHRLWYPKHLGHSMHARVYA